MTLSDVEREAIIRSMLGSLALSDVQCTREEAEAALDTALAMPVVEIGLPVSPRDVVWRVVDQNDPDMSDNGGYVAPVSDK